MSRFRRPKWRDPRLGVGVLLVAVSVALGGWVFAQADKTEPVYVATETIAVGEAVDEAPMELRNVNLGSAQDLYLGPAEVDSLARARGTFIHPVPAGELIPRRAIGTASDLQMRPIAIPLTASSPVSSGTVVDMWVTQEAIAGQQSEEPRVVATGLHVRSVEADDSLFAAANGTIAHVLVPEEDLPAVLGALGSRTMITLVPQLHG